MAEVKDKETTAIAVRQDRALTGTLEEKHRAFQQIAAAMASLQLSGWKRAEHCLAACWLADAAGMHPGIWMQNNHCMEIQGKLMVEPKWEFVLATLQSRVPGFRFKVLVETNAGAKVRMEAPGYESQESEYLLADAQRQGLVARSAAWQANSKEMCFKQAVKRCGRRFAPSALMDLPVGDTFEIEAEVVSTNVSAGDTAKAAIDALVEEVEGGAGATSAGEGTPEPSATSPVPPAENPRKKLETLIKRRYGNITKAVLADRVALVYNAMVHERTGGNPNMKAGAKLGPLDVEQMIEYLEKSTPEPVAEAVQEEMPPVEDEAPPPEEEPAQAQVAEEPVSGPPLAYSLLQTTVGRARALYSKEDRKFLQEYPPASGKVWYVDQQSLRAAGHTANQPLLMSKDGGVLATQAQIEQLNGILAKMCDERERGGR